MASTSSSIASAFRECVACGTNERNTPRVWRCDVCEDYLLCDSCYMNKSLQDCEVESTSPHGHNRAHGMSPCVLVFICDGCGSDPVWNQRWHCLVCEDFDLCEACHEVWDALDMECAHSKEHPMIAVEVLCPESYKCQSQYFSKPADPQWDYYIAGDLSKGGFWWVKTEVLTGVSNTDNLITQGEEEQEIHTSLRANQDNGSRRTLLEKKSSLRYKSSCLEPASETTGREGVSGVKHKIFLSHAGTEKDFVEQLNVDLSRVHHFGTFFDKDDESLPKGEPFPKRIFDAAKQCELAIVVVSDEYFKRKWPMLELAAFVEAQKSRVDLKILPIFYKLSVEQFKQSRRQQSYLKCWNGWVGPSVSKGDIGLWKEALKVVSKTNGIQYEKGMGEVTFREQIVEAVYKQVKPDLIWDDTHVQGKERMHDKIQEMIERSNNLTKEMRLPMIGLYGMGGSGKTTMCKVFCNQMMQAYLGRVCHIELGTLDLVDLLRKLLKSINKFRSKMLSSIDEGQALHLLKEHIPLYKVCMVIDNVWDDHKSFEIARIFLNLPYREGSLILVASRSFVTLEKLKIKKEVITKVPSLNMGEARALFIHHTGCDNPSMLFGDHEREIRIFVGKCQFVAEGTNSWECHPLALKVLGTRVGPYPNEWKETKVDFKHSGSEGVDPIFSILRLGYDALSPRYQRIFLDFALNRRLATELDIDYGGWMTTRLVYIHGENAHDNFFTDVVKVLHAKSLIESYNIHGRDIYIHDLYQEFASMEARKEAMEHSPRCSFYLRGVVCQQGRVDIHNDIVTLVTKDVLLCRICSKAELLSIVGCANLESIDIPDMLNLKMLEVAGGCPKLRSVNLDGAANLQCLVWNGCSGEFPNLTRLESLELLVLENHRDGSPPPCEGVLDFSKSSHLELLILSYLPLKLHDLSHAVRLKEIWVDNCEYIERFEGLESLVSLEEVCLKVCSSLVEFPSLANFPCLKGFTLKGAAKLKEIQGLASLTTLEWLTLKDGRELKELPGVECCTRLKHVSLRGTNLDDYSWISLMKDLEHVSLSLTMIRTVPKCSELTKLSKLMLINCKALVSEGNSNMGNHSCLPQNLDVFDVYGSYKFKVLPQFDYQSALTMLDVSYTSVEDISGVLNCLHLEKLYCQVTRITSLPDLSRLMSLKVLDVRGCELLTRMDNIKGLHAVTNLEVKGCIRLLALPDLRCSKRLTRLELWNCPLVDPNSVKLPVESTIHVEVGEVAEEQSDNVVQRNGNEDQTSVVRMGSQELDIAHSVWALGILFDWIVSCCASRRP